VVSFLLQLLYPQGKSSQYPLNRRLDGPYSQFGCGSKEKNPWPCWESNAGHPPCSLVTILTQLPWFPFRNGILRQSSSTKKACVAMEKVNVSTI